MRLAQCLVQQLDNDELEVLYNAVQEERWVRAQKAAHYGLLEPFTTEELEGLQGDKRSSFILAYKKRVGCSVVEAKYHADLYPKK